MRLVRGLTIAEENELKKKNQDSLYNESDITYNSMDKYKGLIRGLSINEENKVRKASGLAPLMIENKLSVPISSQETTEPESLKDAFTRWDETAGKMSVNDVDTSDGKPFIIALMEKQREDIKNLPSLSTNVDDVIRAQNKAKAEEMSKGVQEFTKDNKVLGTVMNFGLSLTAPTSAAIEATEQFIKSIGDKDYKPDPYTNGMLPSILLNATEEGVLNGLEGAGKLIGGVGLSIGQNAARLPLGPVGLINMATGAGGQAARDVMERGGTMNQAMAKGIVSGGIEYLTEKIPFENLMKLSGTVIPGAKGTVLDAAKEIAEKGIKKSSSSVLKGILKQMGTEAGEEMVSEYVNTIADDIIMGADSEMSKHKKSLIESGLSNGEALKETLKQYFVVNPLLSGLGGAISGGVFGAGGTAIGKARTAETFRRVDKTLSEHNMSNEDKTSITSSFKEFAETPGHENIDMPRLFNAIDSINTKAVNMLGEIFEAPATVSAKFYSRVMDYVTKPDTEIFTDTVRGNADIWADMMEMKNSLLYKALTEKSGLSKEDISGAISNYAVEGDIGSEVGVKVDTSVKKALTQIAKDFKGWSDISIRSAAAVRESIWDNEKTAESDNIESSEALSENKQKDSSIINEYIEYAAKWKPDTGMEKQNSTQPIMPVMDEHADIIKQLIGHDVTGYTHQLTDNDIRHIINSRSKTELGKYAVSLDDIKLIPDILNSPTAILQGNKTNDGRDSIIYEKKYNGKTYYIEVIGHENKVLQTKTILKTSSDSSPFKHKNRIILGGNADVDQPSQNVQNARNNSISNTGQQVNMSKDPQYTPLTPFDAVSSSGQPSVEHAQKPATNVQDVLDLASPKEAVQVLNVPESPQLTPEAAVDLTSSNSTLPQDVGVVNDSAVTKNNNYTAKGGLLNGEQQQTDNPVLQDGGRQDNDDTTGTSGEIGRIDSRRRPSAWGSGYAAYMSENQITAKQGAVVDSTGKTIQYREVTNPEFNVLKQQLTTVFGGNYVFFDGNATVYSADENGDAIAENVNGFTDGEKTYVSFGMETEKYAIHERIHNIATSQAEKYSGFEQSILQLFNTDRFYDMFTKYSDEYVKLYGQLDTDSFDKAVMQEMTADVVSDALTGQLDDGLFDSKEDASAATDLINGFAQDYIHDSAYKEFIDSGATKKEIQSPETESDVDVYFSKPIKYNATEIILRANLREGKVYSMAVAKKVTDAIVNSTIAKDNRGIRLTKKSASETARLTHALLNSQNVNVQKRLAGEIAESIAENAAIDKNVNDFEIFESLYKDLLKYRNKLDFNDADKAELYYLYDDSGARDKLRQWSGGNLPVDTFYGEISEMYPYVFPNDVINTGDQIAKVFEVYDRILDLKNQPTEFFGNVADEATKKALTENIAAQIEAGLERGSDSKVTQILNGAKVREKALTDKIDAYKEEIDKIKVKTSTELRRVRREREEKLSEYRDKQKDEKRRKKESEDRTKLLNTAKRLSKMKANSEFKRQLNELIENLDLVSKGMTDSNRLRLIGLRNEYIKATGDMGEDYIASKGLLAKLDRLDKTLINELTIEDVRDLTDILLGMEHEIKNANKLINDTLNRDVYTTSVGISKEISGTKGTTEKTGSLVMNSYITQQFSPERFFSHLQGWGKGLTYSLYTMLNDGQTKMIDFQMKSTKKFNDFVQRNKNIMKTWQGKEAELIDTGLVRDGKPVRITPAKRIALYLHNLNIQNQRHMGYLNEKGELTGGGVTFPNEESYRKGDYANAYVKGVTIRLTPSQIAEITSGMTPEELEFANLVHEYFNIDSKNAINETSMALDGREIAMVDDYFPIVSDKAFVRQEFESLLRDGTVEGQGIFKNRTDSSNPIILEDVTSVLLRHIDNVSKYVGMAIPIRNFNRIYNTTFSDYGGSVKKTIGKTWGNSTLKYIEKLMTDLQFPRNQRDGFSKAAEKIRGNFAKAVLSVNPGVAMKQTMSLPYAASVLGYDAIVYSLTTGVVDTELVDKYTPLLWHRSQGAIDTEIGEITERQSWDKKLPWLMDWMTNVDIMTTKRIWKASEYYVSKHHRNISEGTEAYYGVVADYFNKTVLQTQSNYTIMQRPQVLRSDNELAKSLTMFSTDRFQAFNMAIQAWGEYNRAISDLKEGVVKRDVMNEARSRLLRSITGLAAGAIGSALINFLNSLLTGFLDKYKDNEGSINTETVTKAALSDAAEMVFGMPLFAAELYNLGKVVFTDDSYNDMQSIPLSTISNTFKSIGTLSDAFSNGGNVPGASRNLAKNISIIAGVPLGNFEKYLLGASRVINSDIKRIHGLVFNPNRKVALYDFWGDSKAVKQIDALNKRIENTNSRFKASEQLSTVSLPTRLYKFTLDKQEYVLSPFDRFEYEKEMKERIEKELSKINVVSGTPVVVRKNVVSAINNVEQELKEKYVKENRRNN